MPEETAHPGGDSAQFNPDDISSIAAAAAAQFTFTRAPDFKTIFSDMVRSRLGHGFINLSFSRMAHKPDIHLTANIVEEHAEIVMTWTQFKMVVQNFVSIISAIETEVGPIPIPVGFRTFDANNREIVRGLGLTMSPRSDAPPRAEGGAGEP